MTNDSCIIEMHISTGCIKLGELLMLERINKINVKIKFLAVSVNSVSQLV